MWGERTLNTVDQIMKKYQLKDIQYQPTSAIEQADDT
jgi:hypothetical protein